MPTFTAIAFDRLIEPRASKPAYKSAPAPMPVPKKLERRSSEPTVKKKPLPRPQLKPALYATPAVTPLPDSPSSFPPSPYIINHKRRGPRLLKSFSEANVQAKQEDPHGEDANGKGNEAVVASSDGDIQVTSTNIEPFKEVQVNGVHDDNLSSSNGGDLGNGHGESESSGILNGSHMDKIVALNLVRDTESEDFFDPHDSMSFKSYTDGEDITGTEQTMKFNAAGGEFFDAWEELSSDSGVQNSHRDIEAELREIRLSLLMEIEKRKLVEESLNSMQSQWERLRQGLSQVGIVLPADLTAESGQPSSDPLEDVYQQIYIARFISNSIGRGIAKAEAQTEMEAQLELKNFEIARLLERLHCYETMNREMSQRNQEAVEMARRERQRRRRRQRWIWGSITTAIALGTAAIAWSYLPMGRESTSAVHDVAPELDDRAN
ncbi:uncharacterized protein LOC109791661 [Cajanus cajan]|uniref:Uncharacterized protein n=1 Tax=Cajanus cajan TaxID=3821 RepID=A0A151QXJ2_CAJCA|nr:uncharacterized protein LOC109791661 [Cajanus cajan]XP_020206570.1 uncharacterized protein LOC109791661 [Cajanus cajan]KYP35067.1 hypothetical protein KK1_043918 [Cajanus cajan]